jgi:hypothetical protein
MKKTLATVALTVAIATLCSCDEVAEDLGYVRANSEPIKQTKPERPSPTHRFVLAEHHSDIAFDTVTGQLCRTWDWSLVGPQAKIDPSTGVAPQRAEGELAPTCLSLYQEYAGKTDPADPLGLFEPNSKK